MIHISIWMQSRFLEERLFCVNSPFSLMLSFFLHIMFLLCVCFFFCMLKAENVFPLWNIILLSFCGETCSCVHEASPLDHLVNCFLWLKVFRGKEALRETERDSWNICFVRSFDWREFFCLFFFLVPAFQLNSNAVLFWNICSLVNWSFICLTTVKINYEGPFFCLFVSTVLILFS